MKMLFRVLLVCAAGVAVALVVLTGCVTREIVLATPAQPASTDPPARVARLSYLSGVVSFNPAGTDDWAPAVLNRPLTTGDYLWTENDARAELNIGSAAIRLSSRTVAGLLTLNDRAVQLKLSQGTIGFRIRSLAEEDTFEVDTPTAAISALRTGDYRIEVNPESGETRVTVWTGQMEVTAPAQAFTVRPGQQARVRGADPLQYEISSAAGRDSFDEFCRDRDRRAGGAESVKYVSPGVIGHEDLDEYGYWRVHGSYGPIWVPRRVDPGWAPYRFGHWVWIEPWGWTWIDDAPWGFAPFHYGRWVYVDTYWGWIPGPIHVRPVYAPALVVFIGGGPGLHHYFRIGVGIGVAWFPLGPREVYIPPYRASRIYVSNVNVTNTVIHNTTVIHATNVSRQRYANRVVHGAVTAVPEETFTSGRMVSRSAVTVSPREATAAEVGGMAPPVIPTRRSLAGDSDGTRPWSRPPEAAVRRPVIVQRTPDPPPPAFDRRRPALEGNPGRPPDSRTIEDLRRAHPEQAPEYRQARPVARPAERERAGAAARGEAQRDRPAADRPSREQEKRRTAIERERNSVSRPGRQKD